METGDTKSTGWRGLRLDTRLGLLLAGLAVLANAVLLSLLWLNSQDRIRENVRSRLREAAALAALGIDAERHDRIADPSQVPGDDFRLLQAELRRILEQVPDAIHVTTMRQDDTGRIVFVVDAGERNDPKEFSPPGEVYDDASQLLKEHFAAMTQPMAESEFYTDKRGTWLTGYAPFFRADGTRAGILGVGMSAASLRAADARYLRRSMLVFAALVPIFLLLGVLAGRRLAAPVKSLREGAVRLAAGEFTHRVEVRAGGEIGELAEAFNAMAGQVEAMLDGLLDELAERQVVEERLRHKERVLEDIIRRRTRQLETSLAEAEDRVAELEGLQRRYAAQCELGSRLADAADQDLAVQIMLDMVLVVEGLDCAAVYLTHEDGSLRLAANRGLGEFFVQSISSFMPGERQHDLVVDGKPVYVEGPGLAWLHEGCPEEGLRSAVVLPLLSGDKVLGSLAGGSHTLDGIPSSARNALESSAALVAGVLARDMARVNLEDLNTHLERLVASRTAALAEQARELALANHRLHEMDAMKNAFLSAMSHELKTPLTSVVGFAKLSARDFERRYLRLAGEDATLRERGERILSNLNIVEHEAIRLGLMVDDVLDLCSMEGGQMVWSDREVRSVPLLLRAAEAVSGLLAAKPGVVLELDLPEGLPDLYLDPDRILRAVVNVLDNAIKFTETGTVRLSASSVGPDALQVRVQDTGQGIASDMRERIFEGFFQGDPAPGVNAKPRGAGLGLTIARRIVEHYGGRIRVESVPGRGSTFIIEL
jgi:signal transduction histidine kinase